MAEAGNPTQWQGGYPQRELIERDIANGYCHLCCKEGECVAVFYFRIGDDPTYKKIYGGKWLSDGDYGVLHRIAVGLHGEGVAAKCFDFCLGRCKSLRLDTHRDNLPMQKALKKHGFTYCGIIYLENGHSRVAYEKTL
jgi:RimJ/RimL family protein N-acetyltransferase